MSVPGKWDNLSYNEVYIIQLALGDRLHKLMGEKNPNYGAIENLKTLVDDIQGYFQELKSK